MGKTRRFSILLALAVALAMGIAGVSHAMDVTLGWNANTETNLKGYKVYYGTTSGGPYNGAVSSEGASPISLLLSSLSSPNNPEFTVHGLPEGKYYFVVTAFNSEGLESGYSNEVYTESSPGTNSRPVLSSLEVNGQTGSTEARTDKRNVAVRVVASDDRRVSHYLILDGVNEPGGKTFLAVPGGPKQNAIIAIQNFLLDDMDGSRTVYAWVRDDQGLISAAASKTSVVLERLPTVVGYPLINYNDPSVTITYSETNMKNVALASNYSFNNGLLISSNGVDVSGTNKAFRFPLHAGTLQPYTIYTLQISGAVTDSSGNAVAPSTVRVNDDDNDGMADDWEKKWFGTNTAKSGNADSDRDGLTDRSEYAYARNNPAWGAARWTLSPLNADSDGDGIPDGYEALNGLNPVNASDRDLDPDQDGWSNYQAFVQGTAANDPNSHSQGSIEAVEVIPPDNAGFAPDTTRIPNNTTFAVRLESTYGIDLRDPDAVVFSINDGERVYDRYLNETNTSGRVLLMPIALKGDDQKAHSVWVSYYRSNENDISGTYPHGAPVEITVYAKDIQGTAMTPVMFRAAIESEADREAAKAKAPSTTVLADTPVPGKKTLQVNSGKMKGAAVIYDSSTMEELGFEPEIGPTEEIPPAPGNGIPLNLMPPAVFPNPVTLIIPCAEHKDVTGLAIYYYDGQKWWLACDSQGNITPEGQGWMVPGSRVNHNRTHRTASYIEIKVHHFSAAAGGVEEPKGSACFISNLWK